MSTTVVFAMGSVGTLAVGLGVMAYLRGPLIRILVELCGNEERAGFWAAFSAVALGTVPLIFAVTCRPDPENALPAVFQLADQMKWGLIGLMCTVLVLGWAIGRTIARWEARARSKS